MRTHAVHCVICEQRMHIAASAVPAQPTCSRECKDALNRRRVNHRRLVAWSNGGVETSQTTPNRAHEALVATRAAVAQLLAEGRRARLTHNGDTPA